MSTTVFQQLHINYLKLDLDPYIADGEGGRLTWCAHCAMRDVFRHVTCAQPFKLPDRSCRNSQWFTCSTKFIRNTQFWCFHGLQCNVYGFDCTCMFISLYMHAFFLFKSASKSSKKLGPFNRHPWVTCQTSYQ